jgi:glutamate synthase domain-containing protein 3
MGKYRKKMGPFFAVEGSHEPNKVKGWNMFEVNSGTGDVSNQLSDSSINSNEENGEGVTVKEKATSAPERPRVVIKNDVGDLIGALNDGTIIEVTGNAGNYAGEGMTAGELTIDGNAGDCAGNAMRGGIIFIKGNADNYVGQSLKGGTVIIGGSIGDFAGAYMISGVILVCGSAGRHLGSSMIGGTIYVKGRCRRLESTADHQRLTSEDRQLVGQLFKKCHLNIPLKGLKKIGPKPKPPI